MAMSPRDDYDRDILDIIPERFDADADSHQARAGHRLRSYLTLGVAVLAVG
ncbi:MAG: SPOR domain-containing protein, partial [Rhodospirillaceae bacterium]|nr:SPOR domain-containing protein [Rhodospirillales bacterium]